jgi:hypothetical protein
VSLIAGFMHLPKTGGNSVYQVITRHVPSLRICPSPRLGVWDHQLDHPQNYDFYAGHFDYDFFDVIGRGALKLTMVRHPVARMVSLYDYWRGFAAEQISDISKEVPDNGPLFASSVDFETFVGCPTPFVRTHTENGLTRQLLGRSYNELKPKPGEMIDKAHRLLSTFSWVGVTENFEKSIRPLSDLLGFKMSGEIPEMNSSYHGLGRRQITRTRPTDRAISIIEHFNRADLALYNRVIGHS